MTTTKLNSDPWPALSTEDHAVQFVPAKIKAEGVQPISQYFTQFVAEDRERGCLAATLVGRPLDGEVLKLPEGKELVVFQAGKADGLDKERTLRAVKRADQVTYWNYDRVPSEEDGLKKALTWMDIAEALHGEDSD